MFIFLFALLAAFPAPVFAQEADPVPMPDSAPVESSSPSPAPSAELIPDSLPVSLPVSLEETTKALTTATIESPEVKNLLQMRSGRKYYARPALKKSSSPSALPADLPIRMKKKIGINILRLAVPEGATAGIEYTVVAPLTLSVCAGGTGLTITICGDATLNLVWTANFTPVLTMRFSNIMFTSYGDKVVAPFLGDIYGDKAVEVQMAGKWMHTVSGLAGFDWVSEGGFHFVAKAGLAKQLGKTHGKTNESADITLQGWWGPTAEIGVGGRFEWF